MGQPSPRVYLSDAQRGRPEEQGLDWLRLALSLVCLVRASVRSPFIHTGLSFPTRQMEFREHSEFILLHSLSVTCG